MLINVIIIPNAIRVYNLAYSIDKIIEKTIISKKFDKSHIPLKVYLKIKAVFVKTSLLYADSPTPFVPHDKSLILQNAYIKNMWIYVGAKKI